MVNKDKKLLEIESIFYNLIVGNKSLAETEEALNSFYEANADA